MDLPVTGVSGLVDETVGGGVLAIFAHPDDESLVAGGTLAACAAAGLDVVVLSLTRGERGPIARPDVATPAALGAVREAELRAACRALSAAQAECLHYPDGELAAVEAPRIAAELEPRIRALRPRAVITFGPDGLYWHPDHVAAHEVTMAALDSLAREGLLPWVYWATWPEGRMQELVAAVAARGLPTHLWGLSPTAFGAPPSSITTVLDVRRFLASKLRALRAYASQLPPDHLFLVLPDDLARQFLGFEHFARARPATVAEDWLTTVVSVAPGGGAPRSDPLADDACA